MNNQPTAIVARQRSLSRSGGIDPHAFCRPAIAAITGYAAADGIAANTAPGDAVST
jgi:hypothetical protein